MIAISDELIEQFASKATAYNHWWLQEIIAFPTKVVGDWVILRVTHADTDSGGDSFSVILYRARDKWLDFVGIASRQLARSIVSRYQSSDFHAVKIHSVHKQKVHADIYLAIMPIRAHP